MAEPQPAEKPATQNKTLWIVIAILAVLVVLMAVLLVLKK